jgi:hypothetical protein
MTDEDWVVVYRGFAAPTLDMMQGMLEAEGLQPRRVGNASPALAGIGEAAIEQCIEVAPEHAQAARALIAASELPASDPTQADELEAQALNAPRETSTTSEADRGGFSVPVIALIVATLLVLFLLLR